MSKPAPLFNPRDVLKNIRERRTFAETQTTSQAPAKVNLSTHQRLTPTLATFAAFARATPLLITRGRLASIKIQMLRKLRKLRKPSNPASIRR
jgi:hypothetical protein